MFFNFRPEPKAIVQSTPAHTGIEGVRLLRSLKARRLALRVDMARGDICLVVPKRVSDKKAWEFAHAHHSWISERLARIQKPIPFAHGVTIPVFGTPRTINVTRTGGRTTHIELLENTLEVRTPRENPATNIKRYLQETLLEAITPAAHEKARAIGRKISNLQLRDTRTRWGSCAPDGRMMLSWRLVFAPHDVIDYVVAHEVAHLRHMDHSKQFWELCENLAADMHPAKKWLHANGESLLRYGTPA